jgi:hypothetical protein
MKGGKMQPEWKPRYLLKNDFGYYHLFFCLFGSSDVISVQSLRLFKGPSFNLPEIKILSVTQSPDTEKIVIKTDEGDLTLSKNFIENPPTWGNNKDPLESLEISDYQIYSKDDLAGKTHLYLRF